MNCLKCGAQLEEGSTSTLCANCQALENLPQEEKPSENTPLGTPESPVSGEPVPPVQNSEPPVETPDDSTNDGQPTSGV